MATANTAAELEGVGRAYGERVALRDVSFALSPGETIAVFGANGFVIGPVIAALFVAVWEIFPRTWPAPGGTPTP